MASSHVASCFIEYISCTGQDSAGGRPHAAAVCPCRGSRRSVDVRRKTRNSARTQLLPTPAAWPPDLVLVPHSGCAHFLLRPGVSLLTRSLAIPCVLGPTPQQWSFYRHVVHMRSECSTLAAKRRRLPGPHGVITCGHPGERLLQRVVCHIYCTLLN